MEEFWEAFELSLRSALWGVGVGFPLAWGAGLALSRRWRGRWVLVLLTYWPVAAPPVTVGYVLLWALGPSGLDLGVVFTWKAAAIAGGVSAFPFTANAVRAASSAMDWRLTGAARSLGAGRLRMLWTTALPLSAGGAAAGLALGFARALGEFGATVVAAGNTPGETRTLPLAVYAALSRPGGERDAWIFALGTLALGGGLLWASEWAGRAAGRRVAGREARDD